MNNRKNVALGIIDVQRGFMPEHEGERLDRMGFGELPVPRGEEIIPALAKIIRELKPIDSHINGPNGIVFTTQDWHPKETAHFSTNPNFTTTWPTHCVQETNGAKLHPALERVTRDAFYKGNEVLADGKDDTSYSGYNARRFDSGQPLPEFLAGHDIDTLYLGGLALDYCVKTTAIDMKEKTDMDVVLLSDATKPVAEETGRLAVEQMLELGIRFMTVDEAIEELRGEQS